MHEDAAHRWTVASLAAKVGMSRAAFAQRFTALVGRPPLGYLTDWRMTLAADLLGDTRQTVAAVARQVGTRMRSRSAWRSNASLDARPRPGAASRDR
jgi:AraC-like DNA-binding protein